MAKSKSPTKKLTDAINELTAHIKSGNADQAKGDRELLAAENASGKERRELQTGNLALNQTNQSLNTDIKGLTMNMLRLHTMLAGSSKRNEDLAKILAKNNLGRKADMVNFSRSADTGRVSLTQAIDTFGDMTEMGMGGYERASLVLASDLKVLGVGVKGMLAGLRMNTQGLGISEDSSREFMDSLVTTAAANRSSINELISVMNSMKEAMTMVAVDLGPQMALNVKAAAAAWSQSNSQMFQPALELITSLVAGTKGREKASRLSAEFQPGMNQESFNRELEKALRRITQIDPGLGNQYTTEAIAAGWQVSHQNLQAVRLLGTDIGKLLEGNSSAGAEAVNRNAMQQAFQTELLSIQSAANEFLATIAGTINALGPLTQFVIGGALIRGMGGVLGKIGAAGVAGKMVQSRNALGQFSKKVMKPNIMSRGIGLAAKVAPFLMGPVGLAVGAAALGGLALWNKGKKADTAAGSMSEYEKLRLKKLEQEEATTKSIKENTKLSADFAKQQLKDSSAKDLENATTKLLVELLRETRAQSRLAEQRIDQGTVLNELTDEDMRHRFMDTSPNIAPTG